jgi:cellulose synthase/poly-beta-1,6-N-acetylglucosamine synthase-like glycosyltransferase
VISTLFHICWTAFQVFIGIHLFVPFLFWTASFFTRFKRPRAPSPANQADYAIIVTAFEEVHSIPAVVDSLLHLNYPNFLIYVVADNCDVSELNFRNEQVVLLTPEVTVANNLASHFYAIRNFRRAHNRITIIDSDNLADPGYLDALNKLFDEGFLAVQGLRKPKNMDTPIARIDALTDCYYHFYDRKLLFRLGSSAALSGSGMAFDANLYTACFSDVCMEGAGFDKVLQFILVNRNYRIAFAADAIVYDEKTSQATQLVSQRSRWISAWMRHFHYGFTLVAKGAGTWKKNPFLFGMMLLRPPLFLLVVLSFLCLVTDLVFHWPLTGFWVAGFCLFVVAFCIALFQPGNDRRLQTAIFHLPAFILLQIRALFNVARKGAYPVATHHFHHEKIDELKL